MSAQLYCLGESGNAYKAALTLALSGYDWEPRYVDFFNGETRSAEFLALNEMGEVPVFVEGDLVLSQSAVIHSYVADQTGQFGGATGAEQRAILRWLFFDNHKVSGVAGALRFNTNFLAPEKRNPGANDFLLMRLSSSLKVLDSRLEKNEWVALERPTIADFSLCGYLYYPEPFGFDRNEYHNIDAWLDRIAALPGWKHPYDLMPGSPADRA